MTNNSEALISYIESTPGISSYEKGVSELINCCT